MGTPRQGRGREGGSGADAGTDDAAGGGTDRAADGAALLRLLATAPPEVRAWLAEHATGTAEGAAESPAGGAGEASAVGADRAAHADADPAAHDDADPTAHEDEDDDILTRRAPAAGAPGPAAPGAPARRGASLRVLVLVALAVGAVAGVWLAGRPAADPDAATPTLAAAVADAEAEARIAALEARLAADPEDVAAHLELGVLLFNAERLDAAGEHWQTAARLAPDEAEAWYNLGFFHASAEPPDHAAARECWERVVAIDPGSELARVATMHLGGVLADDDATGDGAPDGGAPSGDGGAG